MPQEHYFDSQSLRSRTFGFIINSVDGAGKFFYGHCLGFVLDEGFGISLIHPSLISTTLHISPGKPINNQVAIETHDDRDRAVC